MSELPDHLRQIDTPRYGYGEKPVSFSEGDAYQLDDGRWRVFYQGDWESLEDYLALDPRTRTEEDSQLLAVAVTLAAAEDARDCEDPGIPPSMQMCRSDLLERARYYLSHPEALGEYLGAKPGPR